MNRRDFLSILFSVAVVLLIESCVIWRRELQEVYRLRAGKWERIRLFQATHGDRIRFKGTDWKNGTEWIIISNPWFSLQQRDWGVTALSVDPESSDYAENPSGHYCNVPVIVWNPPGESLSLRGNSQVEHLSRE